MASGSGDGHDPRMGSEITYNEEATLTAPDSIPLAGIAVTVEIEPADSGCLIYGWMLDGNIGCVEVRGVKTDLELPFAKPTIYMKYLFGLTSIRISTRGWREAR